MRHHQLSLASWFAGAALALACSGSARVPRPEAAPTPSSSAARPSTAANARQRAPAGPAKPDVEPLPPTQLEPDGNGLPDAPGEGKLSTEGHFERLGRHYAALHRICDLQPHGDQLFMAHATRPLGWDGASLTRFTPDAKQPFELAFDWNRPGQPSKGGGAGQGFLRIRSFDGRLFVPDADPPYLGLGLRAGIEGYLFVSDPKGRFARARHPRKLPPLAPSEDKPGAAVLPRAYHTFDVIRYRGRYYASIGAASPDREARGALLVSDDGIEFRYEGVDYPASTENGVWRLTYMVRYKDRLLTGIESLGMFDPHDYLSWELPQAEPILMREHARPFRVSRTGGASTLRWYADQGKLYWIARDGEGTRLRVTADGETWRVVDLPEEAGPPSDLVRYRDTLVVLTENALLALSGSAVTWVATAPDPSPFRHDDHYCAAPLSVFQGRLYAGGQRKGALYRLEPDG